MAQLGIKDSSLTKTLSSVHSYYPCLLREAVEIYRHSRQSMNRRGESLALNRIWDGVLSYPIGMRLGQGTVIGYIGNLVLLVACCFY